MSLAVRSGLVRSAPPGRPAPASRGSGRSAEGMAGAGDRSRAAPAARWMAHPTIVAGPAELVRGLVLRSVGAVPRGVWLGAAVLAIAVGFVVVDAHRPRLDPSTAAEVGRPERSVLGPLGPADGTAADSPAASGWPPPGTAVVDVDAVDLGAKLVLVGLLLYLALRLMRRFVAPTGVRSGPIVVLASRPLGPKTALHLVALGDRRLLVGESPAGLVGLTELAADELADGLGLVALEADGREAVR